MKRKKDLLKYDSSEIIFGDERVKVYKYSEEYFFEIGNEMTDDLAEAVCILMRNFSEDHEVWNLEFNVNVDYITPEKSLFWLTGGYLEWRSLENYKSPWMDCYLDFQEEFGFIIINTLKKYKKLLDIREAFRLHLNLPILYDFAISKNLTK